MLLPTPTQPESLSEVSFHVLRDSEDFSLSHPLQLPPAERLWNTGIWHSLAGLRDSSPAHLASCLRPREGIDADENGRAGFTKSCGNQEVQITLYNTYLIRKNNVKTREGHLPTLQKANPCIPRAKEHSSARLCGGSPQAMASSRPVEVRALMPRGSRRT